MKTLLAILIVTILPLSLSAEGFRLVADSSSLASVSPHAAQEAFDGEPLLHVKDLDGFATANCNTSVNCGTVATGCGQMASGCGQMAACGQAMNTCGQMSACGMAANTCGQMSAGCGVASRVGFLRSRRIVMFPRLRARRGCN